MRNTIFSMAIAVAIIFSSCKKSTDNAAPAPGNTTPANVLSVNINGQVITSSNQDSTDQSYVYMVSDKGRYTVAVTMHKQLWTSTQSMVEHQLDVQFETQGIPVAGRKYKNDTIPFMTSYAKASFFFPTGQTQPEMTHCNYYGNRFDQANPAGVTFTKLDLANNRASGTFSYTVNSFSPECPGPVTLTEGKFTDIEIRKP